MTHRLPRLLLALATLFCPAFAQAAKPNFVIISIDDLGYADIWALRFGQPDATSGPDGCRGAVADQPLRGTGLHPVAEPLPAVDHNGTVRPDMAGDIRRFP